MSDLVKNMSAFDSFIRLKYKEGVWWNYGKPTHPLYADLWDAWQARVPEGYVVVPKKATSKMLTNAIKFDARLSLPKYSALYIMLINTKD